MVVVDPRDPDVEPVGDPQRPADVGGPDRGVRVDVPGAVGVQVAADLLGDARIAAHEARILALEVQVRDLLDKLKPPSPRVQTPQPPAPAKKPTGKKPALSPVIRP